MSLSLHFLISLRARQAEQIVNAASSREVTASTQEQLAGIEDLASKAEELKKAAEELQQNIN